MKRLTYWVALPKNGSPAYGIRAKTRKGVKEILSLPHFDASDFEKPKKVAVQYRDAFDLVHQAMGEGGIYEG